jgi:hypothetical protein
MRKFIFVSLVAFTLTFVLLPKAMAIPDDDRSYSSYDDIIKELSSSRYEAPTDTGSQEELIRFHAGVGLLTSRVGLNLPNNYPSSRTLQGFEARLGIDLFSRHWIAEGAIRAYDPEIFSNVEMSLKEFDLTVSFRDRLAAPIEYTIGAGMTARYLDFIGNIPEGVSQHNSTPSSVLNGGLIFRFNSALNIGAIASYRNPLIQDTADDGSLDASLRLGGQF